MLLTYKTGLALIAWMTYGFAGPAMATLPSRSISGVAWDGWGFDHIEVFGVLPNGCIWHKHFETRFGWEPRLGIEYYPKANLAHNLSVIAQGGSRLDLLFVDDQEIVRHGYTKGASWLPDSPDFEPVGRGPIGRLALSSWSLGRLDAVGLDKNGSYLHKAWTEDVPSPDGEEWEDLGGDFVSEPTVVSWGPERLDIFGVTKSGSIFHKFWDGKQWTPQGQDWIGLGSHGFQGKPVASSVRPGQMDLWAVAEKDGGLFHRSWDKLSSGWHDWESLGGEGFTNAPQVSYWGINQIILIGLADEKYFYKHWNGAQWSTWERKSSGFFSEPAMVDVGGKSLNLFGVDNIGRLLLQVWDGSSWLPDNHSWYNLGDLTFGSDNALVTLQKSDGVPRAMQRPDSHGLKAQGGWMLCNGNYIDHY